VDGLFLLRDKKQLDLRDQAAVRSFFREHKIDQVYLAAAKVGGIKANHEFPAEFLYDNLSIQNNVIDSAFRFGVQKLLFLGSSCIYPRDSRQPISESDLLAGPLEKTNEPYAIAKIAGIKLCESLNRQYGATSGVDYRAVMPCNLYGPGDNYHPENSHVIPGLIRRIYEAKVSGAASVSIWGTGAAKREFMHVDDLAEAAVTVMKAPLSVYKNLTYKTPSHINVGSGEEVTILELAQLIANKVGFDGAIEVDPSKPDGTPRKVMSSKIVRELGWSPKIDLNGGLDTAISDFTSHYCFYS